MDGAKLIKLMRPGSFTSVEGTKVDFSEAMLAGAAAAYDVVSDPAPIVVGHPTLDAPAFGWVKDVVVQDGYLCAEPDPEKLDPAFAEAVNAGRYSKVSARFYLAEDPNNPKPGQLYLKHVGFLGGAAPGVKGLGTVSFSEEGDGAAITIEQPTETEMPKEQEASFAERESALEIKASQLAEREAAVATKEGEVAAAALAARHAGNVSFAEALVGMGKLAPAGKDLAVIALDGLDDVTTVSFGEGDARQELTPVAALKKLFDGSGTIVAFGEHAAPKPGDADAAGDPQVIADRAVAFAEEQRAGGRSISINAAVRHVMKNQE
jgi:hypothetical protein